MVIHQVFHQMASLILLEIDAGVTQSQVHEIILVWRVDITFALYIITGRFLHEEGITQVIDIILNRIVGYGRLLFAAERVGQFIGICQGAYSRSHDVDKFFQIVILTYAIALLDVLDIGLVEQGFQVSRLLLVGGERQYLWQTSIEHIFVQPGLDRPLVGRHILAENQRVHLYFISSAPEFCNYIFRQESGIASRYIHIHMTHLQETV